MNGFNNNPRTLNGLNNLYSSVVNVQNLQTNSVVITDSNKNLNTITNSTGYLYNNSGSFSYINTLDDYWSLSNNKVYLTDSTNNVLLGDVYLCGSLICNADNTNKFGYDILGADTFTIESQGNIQLECDLTAGTTIHNDLTVYNNVYISGNIHSVNAYSDTIIQETGGAVLDMTSASTFNFKPNGTTSQLQITSTGINTPQLTSSTMPYINSSKYLSSLTNASGFLLNSGAGSMSYRYPLISDVSGLQTSLSNVVTLTDTQTITGLKSISNNLQITGNIVHTDACGNYLTYMGFDNSSNIINMYTGNTRRLSIDESGEVYINNKLHLNALTGGQVLTVNISNNVQGIANTKGFLWNAISGSFLYSTVISGTNLIINGNSILSGTFYSYGDVNLCGALNVLGVTTLTGAVSAGSTLVVTGTTTLTGLATCNNGVNITAGTLSAATIINISNTLIAGTGYISGTLNVGGITTISNTLNANGLLLQSNNSTALRIRTTQNAPILFDLSSTNFGRIAVTNASNAVLCLGFNHGTPALTNSVLDCSGNTILRGTVYNHGIVSICGALTVCGSTIINNSLNVNGPVQVVGTSLMSGTLSVNGITTICGGLISTTAMSGQVLNINSSGSINCFNNLSGAGVSVNRDMIKLYGNMVANDYVSFSYNENDLDIRDWSGNYLWSFSSLSGNMRLDLHDNNHNPHRAIGFEPSPFGGGGGVSGGIIYGDAHDENRITVIGPDSGTITLNKNSVHSFAISTTSSTGQGSNVMIRGSNAQYALQPASSRLSTKQQVQELTYDSKWDDIKAYKFIYNSDYEELKINKECVDCNEYYYSYGFISDYCNDIDHCLVTPHYSDIKERSIIAVLWCKCQDLQKQIDNLKSINNLI